MSEYRGRKPAALTPEQAAERFDTGGESFEEVLASVLAGGPDDGHGGPAADRRKAEQVSEAPTWQESAIAYADKTELETLARAAMNDPDKARRFADGAERIRSTDGVPDDADGMLKRLRLL